LLFDFSRVVVKTNLLELRRGPLLFWRALRLNASEIAGVKSEGSTTTSVSHLYTLLVRTRDHRRLVIADALQKHDADAVAAELRKALALPPRGTKALSD